MKTKSKATDSPYKEIVCEKCGYDHFKLDIDGMIARKQYTICGKCGHQQPLKPGDIFKNEEAKK